MHGLSVTTLGSRLDPKIVTLNPRHGLGRLYASAWHQAQPWVETVLWHVYCQPRLNPQEWSALAHQTAFGGSHPAERGLELQHPQ